MTKEVVKNVDLINVVAEGASISKGHAKRAINALYEYIYESLKHRKSVRIPKVGTLSVVKKKATTYCDPKTKQMVRQAETERVKFTISSVVKGDLRSGS
ncbi:HU family DNA-binding protein [Neorickettsia risticii]|uniref:DNA-binding protein HU n=1 Tax=Neorickettsia risticii (strain Illinois) TaxID=434131 RepID=C6V5C1_NEORI|nr:HU family DNA-binding protein [Neorickettsia risticii]ACT69536.1 DNA-binding protein HU [Neorickettsia risticii str. Illinois]